MNRKAFNRINYGLFIVAAAADGKRNGCIVNSLHQVTSSSPYKFSLTVNKSNETFKTIEAAGSFAATVLAKDTPKDLVDLFGYKSGRVVDKFEGFDVQTDEAGNPYVKDHALARISCKIVEKLDLGTYMLYIGEATEAETLGEGPALTVDDFKNGGVQRLFFLAQLQKLFRLGAFFFQRAHPAFQFAQNVPQALKVLARRSKAALGFGLAVAVFCNAAGFLIVSGGPSFCCLTTSRQVVCRVLLLLYIGQPV